MSRPKPIVLCFITKRPSVRNWLRMIKAMGAAFTVITADICNVDCDNIISSTFLKEHLSFK